MKQNQNILFFFSLCLSPSAEASLHMSHCHTGFHHTGKISWYTVMTKGEDLQVRGQQSAKHEVEVKMICCLWSFLQRLCQQQFTYNSQQKGQRSKIWTSSYLQPPPCQVTKVTAVFYNEETQTKTKHDLILADNCSAATFFPNRNTNSNVSANRNKYNFH